MTGRLREPSHDTAALRRLAPRLMPDGAHAAPCRDWYEMDRSVNTAYFRLVADKQHTFKGPFEKAGKGGWTGGWARAADAKYCTVAVLLLQLAHRPCQPCRSLIHWTNTSLAGPPSLADPLWVV